MRLPARLLLPLIYLGFVSLGLPDGALGVAWPAIYPELALPVGLAGTIVTVGTLFASISGFSSGWLLARWQAGPIVLVSCILTSTGLLVLAHAHNAAWLYATTVPLGFGAGAVDACLNGFVARHYAGRHMNWLHACWGVGATLGPLLLGHAIGSGQGWRVGYLGLGLAQATLAVLFACTLGWWQHAPERAPGHEQASGMARVPTAGANSAAGWLSPGIFALYVAVEMVAGIWAGTVLVVGRGFTAEVAAICTASYYAAITVGRIAIGFVVDHFGNRRSIMAGVVLSLVGAILFATSGQTPALAAVGLVVTGLGFSPIYPCLMHEVPRRFAPEAVQTIIGRQSGGAGIGAAVVPALAGVLVQESVTAVPWLIAGLIVVLAGTIRQLDRIT